MNCYLLAGGRSVRMGRSKGELFARRIIEAARAAFDDVIAVQRSGGARFAELQTIYDTPAPLPDGGPVFGVLAALRHARASCFVLAVDYPLMTPELLRMLRDRFASGGASLLVPEWNGHPQMLCAGYGENVASTIERRVAAGHLDLRGLLAQTSAEIIPERELRARFTGEPLMNVNTPEELAEAERIHGRS